MVKTVGHGNEIGIRIMKSGQKAKDGRKGHPWLFVRFVVLSGRMVRRPLKYLQRPVRSWNLAAYTSVLYIIVSYEYIALY